MLKRLSLENFSVFSRQEFKFSPNINVIVGENGAGKTHLLKVLYSVIAASFEGGRKAFQPPKDDGPPEQSPPTKSYLQKAYAEKIKGVFQPDKLGRLVSRTQGRSRCQVVLEFDDPDLTTSFNFATPATAEVRIDQLPSVWQPLPPLYIPTRELLTLYPGFVALYEARHLPFEETWRDTCLLLAAPALKGARELETATLLEPIEQAMGGKVILDNGRFYLKAPGQGNLEIHLVAEGIRKLAMLARLIATGGLRDRSCLFWDEPEANLNPRLIKVVAQTLNHLARSGIQIFLGSHSFFLLKELELLNKDPDQATQLHFIGLDLNQDGEATTQEADHFHGLKNVVLLDEELHQYERELALG